MNFPPFWARGRNGSFLVWRWSFQSVAEAQALANQAAQQLAERFCAGNYPPKPGGYYPNRPFREPVLQEIRNAAGEISAVVTRNSYGCQVLNTARIMFVDIDLPEPKRAGGFFKRLLGKPDPSPRVQPEAEALARIAKWTQSNAAWGWRIYRTRAGLRLMATHGLVEPDTALADTVFAALGADPLYRQLCKTQKCFRARLTPKPWRCGVYDKPQRWPWLDPKQELRFQNWEARYQNQARAWATCALIQQAGNPQVHPEIQPLLNLHDEATRAESLVQLA